MGFTGHTVQLRSAADPFFGFLPSEMKYPTITGIGHCSLHVFLYLLLCEFSFGVQEELQRTNLELESLKEKMKEN